MRGIQQQQEAAALMERAALLAAVGLDQDCNYISELLAILNELQDLGRPSAEEAVEPRLRAAVKALALGIATATTSLASALDAHTDERIPTAGGSLHGPAAAARQRRARRLVTTAYILEAYSDHLLLFFTVDFLTQRANVGLASRIASAAVAITDTGARAFALIGAEEELAAFENLWAVAASSHANAFHTLLFFMKAMPPLGELAALRATTFTPDVVLSCLRQLLLQPRLGRADPSFTCGPAAVLFFEQGQNVYSTELAAILKSPELKAAIIQTLEADLERYAGPRQASCDESSLLNDGSIAMDALSSEELASDVASRASARPAFISVVAAATDRFLLEAPSRLALQGLARGLFVAQRVYIGQTTARLISPQEMLGSIRRAVAVMSSLLHDYPNPGDLACLRMGSTGFCRLLDLLVQGCLDGIAKDDDDIPTGPVLNCRRPGELAAALSTLEAIARLAAFLPESLPSDVPGAPVRRMDRFNAIAGWFLGALEKEPVEESASVLDQEALGRVPGLVESCMKLALVAMRPPGQGADSAYDANRLQFSNVMLSAAGLVFERAAQVLRLEPWAALAPETATRLLSMALAVWDGMASAEQLLQQQQGSRPYFFGSLPYLLIARHITVLPHLGRVVLGSKAGRDAFLQLHMRLLEVPEDMSCTRLPFPLWVFFKEWGLPFDGITGGSDYAQALACCGALTPLARWAELNAVQLVTEDPEDGPDRLFVIIGIVAMLAPEIKHDLCCRGLQMLETPAFWRRVQMEVIKPMEAALAAEAAAADADAAVVLALAVEAALALGTRPCAHTGCTTVVGASEAGAARGKKCAGCEAVRYCSRDCQHAAWRAHKAACRELQAQRGAGPAGS